MRLEREASVAGVRPALGPGEVPEGLGVGLDEQAGPVALGLQEERVAEVDAVPRAGLHEEAARLATEQLVNDLRLLELATEKRRY